MVEIFMHRKMKYTFGIKDEREKHKKEGFYK